LRWSVALNALAYGLSLNRSWLLSVVRPSASEWLFSSGDFDGRRDSYGSRAVTI
jgi:hypothetical protein